jgi:hypothetical protein
MPGLPVDRAAIKSALFTRLQSATFSVPINGFTTWAQTSRRLKLFNNVDPSNQPAMFLVQHHETYEQYGTGRLTRRFLNMGVWCYAPTGEESIVGDDLLDLMETAIETVLQPDDPFRNELTLGGLLTPNNGWCRIDRRDGMFIRDPGDIDNQALLIMPIRILLP